MDAKTLMLLVSGIAVAAKVLWELYLSPLARQHIPGPKRAAISDVWQYLLQLRGIRVTTFHDVFERYGPVVRIGPNTVAFRNVDTLKTIYSGHKYLKSDWYNVFAVGGAHTMFTHLDPTTHTRSRRLGAPAFKGENLRAAGPIFLQEMEKLVGRLRHDSAGGNYVDVVKLFPRLTVDFVGHAVLGVNFDQISTDKPHDFQKHLQSWVMDKLLVKPLPHIVRWLPIPALQNIVGADAAMAKYSKEFYEKADEKSVDGRWNLVETYKAYRDPETKEPATTSAASAEISVMLIAGTETTAISLTYLAYHLALNKNMWNIIRSELTGVQLEAEDFLETLRGLPYLNAFIREMLRVHGPGPVFFERVVPAGGATFDGYFIPEGTRVGGQAYSSHLDARIYPKPYVLDPLRWVQLDENTGKYYNRDDITPAMNANFFPYGLGTRSCVGKALADLELILITATIVQNFKVHLHDSTTPESMSPAELFVVGPRSGRCLLRFEYAPIATA